MTQPQLVQSNLSTPTLVSLTKGTSIWFCKSIVDILIVLVFYISDQRNYLVGEHKKARKDKINPFKEYNCPVNEYHEDFRKFVILLCKIFCWIGINGDRSMSIISLILYRFLLVWLCISAAATSTKQHCLLQYSGKFFVQPALVWSNVD